jgi:hypothetical protein
MFYVTFCICYTNSSPYISQDSSISKMADHGQEELRFNSEQDLSLHYHVQTGFVAQLAL